MSVYSTDDRTLIDKLEREVNALALESNRNKDLSATIKVVVALTPAVAANRQSLERRLEDVLSYCAKQFARKDIGPTPGNPFNLTCSFFEE